MAHRQMARPTEPIPIKWPESIAVTAVSKADAGDIGDFLLRINHPLHPGCGPRTRSGARYYVTRLFDYHRHDKRFPLALQAGTILRRKHDGTVIGMCLIGGGGTDGCQFGIYDMVLHPKWRNQKLGTRMINRALTVLAENGVGRLHLWCSDTSPAIHLYKRLGFTETGATE